MLDQGGGTIDWDDFRFVLAIVRGGSVSAAAKQLGVDHATVIRRVDRLERHLSAKLFDRRKTGYLLTEAGQRVADSAEAMESTIVANQEAVGGSRAHLTGTVRIGAPDGFGSHFLASRLVKFTERYPDLDLQLVATARLFSLSKREADIAISLIDAEGRPDRRAQAAGLQPRALCRARLSRPRAQDHRAAATCPGHRFVGYIEELLFTPELDYLPQVSPKISAKFRSANLIAQLNATIAGFGIAVLPHFMATAHPELRAGVAGRGHDLAHLLAVDARRQQGSGADPRGRRLHLRDRGARARAVQRGLNPPRRPGLEPGPILRGLSYYQEGV